VATITNSKQKSLKVFAEGCCSCPDVSRPCDMDHFYHDPGLKICLNRNDLDVQNRCLNDVIFIWFTNKKLFTLSTLKNSKMADCMHL